MKSVEIHREVRREIARLFPGGEPIALTLPLAELEQALTTPREAAAILDLLEDVLESLLREAGWPERSRR